MINKQGSKSIPVKVNPGVDVNTIPLRKYRKIFRVHFTKAGNLKQKALHTTRHTWAAHNDKPKQFLGFFIADIHHKTQPDVLPVRFYIFKDTASPSILLSYAPSERLGIVKFQIPNEALSTALDTISLTKHVTFRTLLCTYRPVKPTNSGWQAMKPAIKFHIFQDHSVHSSKNQPFQDHATPSSKKQPFQDQSTPSSEKQLFQDQVTPANVHDIVAIKAAFPKSFETVGNMPGTYTIRRDLFIPPVQHARCKVPTECREQIEKALQHMEDLQIITPVAEPTEWVSSITYPCKPDGTVCMYLDPKDLNKAIIREHYKAPTLEEISHKLAGVTIFSKLDAKYGF